MSCLVVHLMPIRLIMNVETKLLMIIGAIATQQAAMISTQMSEYSLARYSLFTS